jgi:hypothetical protein
MQRVFGVNPFPLGLITHPGIVEAWRYFFRLKKKCKELRIRAVIAPSCCKIAKYTATWIYI